MSCICQVGRFNGTEQIRMLTTNVTKAEVIRKHTSRDFVEMKYICSPKLRDLVYLLGFLFAESGFDE